MAIFICVILGLLIGYAMAVIFGGGNPTPVAFGAIGAITALISWFSLQWILRRKYSPQGEVEIESEEEDGD
jgi:hypothetical protein